MTIKKSSFIQTLFVLCCIALFSIRRPLFAVSVDTLRTNNGECILLIGDDKISILTEKYQQKVYYYDSSICEWSQLKSLIDSCVWQKYNKEEIAQGHARFIFYVLLRKDGKIDNIYFSKPFSTSDETFYLQITSHIKEIVKKESSNWKRVDRNRYFFSIYTINLFP